MLFGIFIILYVIVCLILCALVLIQSDKGGGISGTLGGGFSSASNLLGAQDTAVFLTRGTSIFAGAFMVLCIVISLFVSRTASTRAGDGSLMKQRAEQQESFAPASIFDEGAAPGEGEGSLEPITDLPGTESSGESVPTGSTDDDNTTPAPAEE